MKKKVTKRKKTKKQDRISWKQAEDSKLFKLVRLFSPQNWTFIAKQLGNRNGKQCRERWYNHLDPNIKKTPFSKAEELKIINLQNVGGNKWSNIAKFLPGRTENSIKNHWNNNLKKVTSGKMNKMKKELVYSRIIINYKYKMNLKKNAISGLLSLWNFLDYNSHINKPFL